MALVLILAAAPVAAGGPFVDVPADHWAAGSIAELRELAVVSGDGFGHFFPDRPITRAELAKLIVTGRGWQTEAGCNSTFTDVPGDSWFCPYVEMAYRMAVVRPLDPDARRYFPHAIVDREELFTTVLRSIGLKGRASRMAWGEAMDRVPFADRSALASYARPYVALAVEEGLVAGYGDNHFRPKADTTRAEAAALLQRVLAPRLTDPVHVTTVDGRKIHYHTALDMRATAYGSGQTYLNSITYLGLPVREGIVAVDPEVIPLGTHLYVEGYGYAVAADTGRLIKGNKIDLWMDSDYASLMRFGVQQRRVYLLD